MADHISSSIINNILSQTNIVELINTRIQLKKKGKNFYACCPFHQEKNPSFSVSYEKQFYYCFSCCAHGNAIDFLMQYDNLGFIESIKELAFIHGINITQKYNKTTNNPQYQEQKKLYELMNQLNIFYQKNLIKLSSKEARKYLQMRGLNIHIIKYFNIGFATNEWQNIKKTFGTSETDKKFLHKTGMLITNHQGFTYDRFRERIMFPIRNKYGQVIAFGGRKIGVKEPKYLNSPDTEIFQKRNQLYGLYELRKKNNDPPYILLVEGYMDVIALTQFGIHYVVASLGTSTTKIHIQLLYQNTNQIICCYDGDQSGEKAAWRTLQITAPYLTDTRILSFIFLPKKEDPDTLIRKFGKQEFLKYIKCAEPLSNFLFKTLLKKIDIQTIEGRSKLAFLTLPIIKKIPGNILRMQLLQELGKKIGILDEYKLNNLLERKEKNKKNYQPLKNTTINTLINLLIQQPKLAQLIPITHDNLKKIKKENVSILIELIQFCKTYPKTTPGEILEYYRTKKIYTIIKAFIIHNHTLDNYNLKTTFNETLNNLYNFILMDQQEKLIAKARQGTLTQEQREELWQINKKLAKK